MFRMVGCKILVAIKHFDVVNVRKRKGLWSVSDLKGFLVIRIKDERRKCCSAVEEI